MRLVVAALLVDDATNPSTLLAARRVSPEDMAGRYELPGGKQEPDEAPIDALHREILEELGVTIRIHEEVLAPTADQAWPLTPTLHMRTWVATVLEGTPRPLEEHDHIQWVGLDTWHHLPWLNGDLPIIEHWVGHATANRPPTT